MLCLTAAALSLALPLQTFTLAWTHSIEKIRWEEDYEVSGSVLRLTEARIRGHGAGMEVPEGAILRDGVWHYKPAIATVESLNLARSPYTADYELCWDGVCRSMREVAGTVEQSPQVIVSSCDAVR
jgi:hypothetical protein